MSSTPNDPPPPEGPPPAGGGHSTSLPSVAAYLDWLASDQDAVAGSPPVPITVWRAVAAEGPPTEPGGALTPSVERRLVATYSRPGGTIIDCDDDAALRHAALAGGRGYLPMRNPAGLATLPTVDVDMITLRWPRAEPASQPAVVDLFTACRLLLGRRGHVVVIVGPPLGTSYVDHASELVPAARAGGLGYLQHVVAVLTPIRGDQLQTPPPHSPAYRTAAHTGSHIRVHLDVLVFVVTRSRHG